MVEPPTWSGIYLAAEPSAMFSGRAVTLALWSGSLFSGRAAQSFSAAEPLTPAFSAAEPFNIYERASIFFKRAHMQQYAQRARLGLYKRRARRHSLRTDTSRNALNCSETYARPESSRFEEIILHSGRAFAKVGRSNFFASVIGFVTVFPPPPPPLGTRCTQPYL